MLRSKAVGDLSGKLIELFTGTQTQVPGEAVPGGFCRWISPLSYPKALKWILLCFPPTKHVIAWGQKQRENKYTKCCVHVDHINLNESELALLKPEDRWKFTYLGAELDLKWKINPTLWSICILRELHFLRKLQKQLKGGGFVFFINQSFGDSLHRESLGCLLSKVVCLKWATDLPERTCIICLGWFSVTLPSRAALNSTFWDQVITFGEQMGNFSGFCCYRHGNHWSAVFLRVCWWEAAAVRSLFEGCHTSYLFALRLRGQLRLTRLCVYRPSLLHWIMVNDISKQ